MAPESGRPARCMTSPAPSWCGGSMTVSSVARRSSTALAFAVVSAGTVFAQAAGPTPPPGPTAAAPAHTSPSTDPADPTDQTSGASDAHQGFTLPSSDKLRFTIDFLAGYGTDRANATLGF